MKTAPALLRPAAIVAALALAAALAGCGSDGDAETDSAADTVSAAPADTSSPTAKPEKKATASSAPVPETLQFSGTTVAGASFDGASLAGKPAVLWFWAPWCPTCRGQIGNVSALAREYDGKVSFVGVGSLDTDTAAIKEFAGDVDAPMPHLSDPDGAVWRHFSIVEQSTFVVLDEAGKVVTSGYLSDSDLADEVAALAS